MSDLEIYLLLICLILAIIVSLCESTIANKNKSIRLLTHSADSLANFNKSLIESMDELADVIDLRDKTIIELMEKLDSTLPPEQAE